MRIFSALRIDEVIRLENGSSMSGEDVMLRGIYELIYAETQHNVGKNVFGVDYSH